MEANIITIIRHVKIREEATPYDPAFNEFFVRCKQNKNAIKVGQIFKSWFIERETLGTKQDRPVNFIDAQGLSGMR